MPFKRRSVSHTDTRPSHEAWDHGLEALTLQTRAVEAMIALDPLRARAMYEEMVLPDLPNPTCDQVLTPNVDGLYETALKVFDPASRKENDRRASRSFSWKAEFSPCRRRSKCRPWAN